MLNVAIVGSRDFNDYDLMYNSFCRYVLRQNPEKVELVSGGAQGADTLAERLSEQLFDKKPHIFYANWDRYGKAAGPMRKEQIVRRADIVLAFWNGKSRGTKDTINKAIKAKKPVIIVPF